MDSCGSKPEFWASILGMIIRASAKAYKKRQFLNKSHHAYPNMTSCLCVTHFYSKLGSSVDTVDEVRRGERSMSCYFKCTSTRNDTAILDGILDGPQTITNSILDLSDCVLVRTLNEKEGEWLRESESERETERETERERERMRMSVSKCIL